VRYVPRAQFIPFHNRVERWALMVCHRRMGKTVAAVNETIGRALHTPKPNARYAYLAPYREQAKRVAWDYLLRYTEGMRANASIADLTVTLYGDRRISLFGADNADALRGQYFDGIAIDEPGNMRPSVFTEIIRPALSDRSGWAVFLGTPNGKNEFFEYNEKARTSPGGPTGWYYLNVKASESGILPQAELDDARSIMSDDEYAQEYENDFGAAIKGSIYGKQIKIIELEDRLTTLSFADNVPVHTCWDIGFSDQTVIWLFQVIARVPCVIDCIAVRGADVHEVAHALQQHKALHGYTPGFHYLPHDAWADTFQTGRSTVEQLLTHGIRARPVPSLSVQDGIQATRLLLRTVRLNRSLDSGPKGPIEALRQYQYEYDEKTQTYRQKPRHDWASDYCDALRIGALGYKEDYGTAPPYVPPKYQPKPLITEGMQLNKLWDTAKRPVGRWGRRI
jgi:hypothetical protein